MKIINPRVKKVKPLNDFKIFIVFENGEERIFDVKPYLDKGIFTELKDLKKFNSARVAEGTVTWENEADFCPDTLFEDSVPYKKQTRE
jgi:hypothetical protein